MATVETYLHTHRARFTQELVDFVRIPSISALPEHANNVQQAAEWVANRLSAAGADAVRVMPTEGHPVAFGEWLRAPGKPTFLVYGHFDTQPVDPLELWTSPPFEPVVRDGRLYGRGVSDSKANVLITILALEAMIQSTGTVPVNLKFLFEGQEEIGSPQLPAFVDAHRELLACDLVLNSDALQWSEDQSQLLVGLRGLCGLQIEVRGANADLHSGLFGGAVPNPIHALVQILDSLHTAEGAIAVEGFYDDVVHLSDSDRKQMAAVPFDETTYRESLGLTQLAGEQGYSPIERLWGRPTLDVNGIWGGFQGQGVKTVIPATAHAKITCRLVPDQDPVGMVEVISAHIERHAPPSVRVSVQPVESSARPYKIPPDHWGNRAAHAVLEEVYGKAPFYARLGGSVPVLDIFLRYLNAMSVSFGFTLEDEQFHAPNEFFRLSSFERGPKAWCMLWDRLGQFEHVPE
ncbi:MAG: dipeptidase [Chloroflexota bacterium]